MAGLLDFLSSDDAKLGLGLLAAGGPSSVPLSFGQRVQGAMQGLEADKQQAMRTSLLKSQIDENATQAELRKQQLALALRKQAWDEQFMGGGLMGGGGPAAPVQSAGAAPAGVGAQGAAPAQGGGFNAQAISQKFGIPVEAVIADYRFNGGKKIAELVAKRAEPNWVNVGGNLVDTNAAGFKGGLQDQVSISNDGRATVLRANGGNPVVGAPAGALATYGAYQGIANRSNADYTPQEIIGEGGRKVVVPRSSVLQPAAGGAPAGYATEAQMKTTVQGDMGADPKAVAREIQATKNDLMKPGLDESSKQALREHLAGLQRTASTIGSGVSMAPMAGNVVALSPAEEAANKAAEVKAVDTAKADVTRDTGVKAQGKSAAQAIETVSRARELLRAGPTASGVGQLVDKGMNFIGQNTKGAETAAALDVVAGDLLRSIPRMEGPQSDKDVENYKIQAGRAADRSTPVQQRLAALDEVERLNRKYAGLNGGLENKGGATGSFDGSAEKKAAPKVIDALPTPNGSNKGQRIRDTTTGKILRSDGMQWKEE